MPRQSPALLLGFSVLLSGCSGLPDHRTADLTGAQPLLLDAAFVSAPDVAMTSQDMLLVTDEMRQFISHHVPASATEKRKVDLVLAAILENGVDLKYDSSETLTAAEAFTQGEGNCLSFTNLYVALAREVGLDARFQEVRIPSVWEENSNTWQLNRHINVTLVADGERVTVDFDPAAADIPRWRRTLSDEKALARYHSNRGVHALYAGDTGSAYAHMRQALELDPYQGFIWNNLGTLYRRTDNSEQAEQAYLHAIALDNEPTAMSNLATLYRQQGDTEFAEAYEARVERFRGKNPYFLYHEAWREYHAGKYRESESLVRKAIRLGTEDHRFYWLWAINRLAQQDKIEAEALLVRAELVAMTQQDKSRYQNKLTLLAAH